MSILNLKHELVILEASGADATTYLQGQLTNDIRELSAKSFQFSAHLNNKGRILATFIITSPSSNKYLLITPKNLLTKILPRLKIFILRSKVTLIKQELEINLATQAQTEAHSLELAPGQYLNIGGVASAAALDSNAWHKFLVTQQIPMIYLESLEKIIPQQINYDLLGGVNFKKGCYTGQEIVARTHYLGKVKRRLAKFTTCGRPQIGQTVVSPTLDNQEIGFIVDFYSEAGKFQGLVSLQTNCLDSTYLDPSNTHKLECTLLTIDPLENN